jgi:hypothetical protein
MSYVKNPERIANKDQLSGYAGLDASGNGHVGLDHLGDGSANASTFLRGDQTWALPPGAGAVVVTVVNQSQSPYSVLTSDYVLLGYDTTIPHIEMDLPDAATNVGKIYVIKKQNTTDVAIIPLGGNTIDGDASENLTVQYDSISIVADASGNWNII